MPRWVVSAPLVLVLLAFVAAKVESVQPPEPSAALGIAAAAVVSAIANKPIASFARIPLLRLSGP